MSVLKTDAVVTMWMIPAFVGTPEETREWLSGNPDANRMLVFEGLGKNPLSAKNYLAKNRHGPETIPGEVCPRHTKTSWTLADKTWLCVKCINEL